MAAHGAPAPTAAAVFCVEDRLLSPAPAFVLGRLAASLVVVGRLRVLPPALSDAEGG